MFGWLDNFFYNRIEKKKFWEKVDEVLEEKTLCSSGWDVSFGSTSCGYYPDAVESIRKYEKSMSDIKYFVGEDYLFFKGKVLFDCNINGGNFNKGEKIEIKMYYY